MNFRNSFQNLFKIYFNVQKCATYSYGKNAVYPFVYNTKYHHIYCNKNVKLTTRNYSTNYTEKIELPPVILSHELNKQNVRSIIRVLNNLETYGNINEDDGLFLLRCCGKMIPNRTPEVRINYCTKMWNYLAELGINFTVDFYNTLLQVSTENKIVLNFEEFLSLMKCTPSPETYKLLLENICANGKVTEAKDLLEIIKKNKIPMDERIFNAMTLGHAIHGGIKESTTVLETMNRTLVKPSSNTYTALLKGLAIYGDQEQFFTAIKDYQYRPNELQFLEIVYVLASHNYYLWIPKMMKLMDPEPLSKASLNELEEMCIHLVNLKLPETAVYIYSLLVEPAPNDPNYLVFLLREMLQASTPVEIIIQTANMLKETGKNNFALEQATEMALKNKNSDSAWSLMKTLPTLRHHYFWPLILQSGKRHGEWGVVNVLKKTKEFGVNIEYETIAHYCLPFCDASNPRLLVERMRLSGYTVKQLLTPILSTFLRNKQIFPAAQLCDAYNVQVESEKLVRILAFAWRDNQDTNSVISIVKRMCHSDAESVGHFLVHAFKSCNLPSQYQQLFDLVAKLQESQLKISSTAVDTIMQILNTKLSSTQVDEFYDHLHRLVDLSMPNFSPLITHPSKMNLNDMECHLIELQNKKMETRGLLRRLIEKHSQFGNYKRVQELYELFNQRGYRDTPGMKASLLQSYIQGKDLNAAYTVYNDMKSAFPKFYVDDFKIIDFASLMVLNEKFASAIELIKAESENRTIRKSPELTDNCIDLLNNIKDINQAERFTELLIQRGYSEPNNNLLSPVVRLYLERHEFSKAVQFYRESFKKYKCTPLRIELLQKLLRYHQQSLVNEVLLIITDASTVNLTHYSYIMALAQEGLSNSLRNYLIEKDRINKDDIKRMCMKWIHDRQIVPLRTCENALEGISTHKTQLEEIHHAILQIYSLENNCEAAVTFWRELQEHEKQVSSQFKTQLRQLLKRCNYEIPLDLLSC